ncbi:phosphotransferase enzyme family protein [Photobacterium sp. 1_MG-2023]|uniref:phosphotransferase enzyme family protein n=1 Tax=Photobacterium sp. 1_MG-2023 TaxID=3062646 RepID=UPI0026E29FFC|nr:phosphotransferase [Photobacterium sp. 1_MG-2023]MDO6705506.1 phosphotransferase [Photobacterium sp. 1_MG-2023]
MQDETITDILRFWPKISGVQSVHPVTLGATNRIYHVAGTENYFLKQYQTQDVAKVQREHQLISHLSQILPEVIAPMPTQIGAGEGFVQVQGDLYALFPQATGQLIPTSQLTCRHASAAGKMLGRLHHCLRDYPAEGFPTIPLEWDNQQWCQRLERVIALIQAQPVLQQVDHWALRRATQQKQFLQCTGPVSTYQPHSRFQLIHGDYHQYNVFFGSDSQVTGVIDWDLLMQMPPGYEVARACTYLFQMRVKESLCLIQAYLKENPLTDDELLDGANCWGIFADHHLWPLEAVYLHQNPAAAKFIPLQDFEPWEARWRPVETILRAQY